MENFFTGWIRGGLLHSLHLVIYSKIGDYRPLQKEGEKTYQVTIHM